MSNSARYLNSDSPPPAPHVRPDPQFQRHLRLLDLVPTATIVRHLDGTITFWNQGAEALYGWRKEEVLGRRTHDLLRTQFPEPLQRIIEHVREGHTWSGELQQVTRDGRAITTQSDWVAEFDSKGEIVALLESSSDITERKRAQEALSESRARLNGIINSAMDAIISIGEEQRIILFNPAAERMFGLTAAEAIGQPIERLIPQRFRHAHARHVQNFERTGVSNRDMGALGMVSGLRANGVEFPIEASISQVQIGSQKLFTVILRDISQRLAVESDLRESEERFRALAENIPQLAWMAHPDGSVFWWNRRWVQFTGLALEQMQRPGSLPIHHPDHAVRVRDSFQCALQAGQPWEETFPLRAADGSYRWFLARAFPIRDQEGHITRWFGTNTDITDLRNTHEALAQAQAELKRHADRLSLTVSERTAELRAANAELEAFCYSLSHDMRGPLRAIRSFTELAIDDSTSQLSSEARDFLQRVLSAAERLDRLIQEVLAFSRLSRGQVVLSPINPEPLVRQIIYERPELQEPAAQIKIESPLPRVQAHEPSLVQCLTNLLDNAVKFVAPGTIPCVRVFAVPLEENVRLCIQDNGIGVDPGARSKIFDLFERGPMANRYEGTGVGLAIVRKACQRMGARAGVESEPGKGSCFWIELQRANEAPRQKEGVGSASPILPRAAA